MYILFRVDGGCDGGVNSSYSSWTRLHQCVFPNHISWISDATSVGRVLSWVMLVLAY